LTEWWQRARRLAARRHKHGAARKGAAPLPPSRARRALEKAARGHRDLRGRVLELLDRAEREGRSAEWLAGLLAISATTLRRWRAEQGAGKLAPELRGPRPFRTSPAFLRALVECVEECTLMGARALHRALPEIPRRWLEWLAARIEERRERRAWRGELIWTRPGSVWTMDHTELESRIDGALGFLFVVRDLASGRVLTALPTRSTDHDPVARELERLFELHGKPKILRSDNGREFIAATLQEWLGEQGVQPAFIEKGSPQQNPYVERFNGTMRDEVLRGEDFDNVLEARVVLQAWVEEYNERRPHRGLGLLTPRQFAARWKAGTE
jgi:transposase InsO family protein